MAMNEMQGQHKMPGGEMMADSEMSDEGGYEICIKVGGDGQISVGVEKGQESAESGEMAMMDGESYQPAGSWDEAMQIAQGIYQNEGKMDSRSEDEQIQSGYSKGAKPMMDKMTPQRVFGD